ncbi:MAG: hypothetical protein JWO87_218 [Phycisphaerales bacterium]|nr:hypothetical protein [Phycisphaerales bacterium]
MEKELERAVRARARHCCEYYRMPESSRRLRFSIDHIVLFMNHPEDVAYPEELIPDGDFPQ